MQTTMLPAFVLFADGRIEQITDDGETAYEWRELGLFDELVLAGYPLHRCEDQYWDGILDVLVDGDEVIACTTGPAAAEHRMGAAAELFLAWYRENAA